MQWLYNKALNLFNLILLSLTMTLGCPKKAASYFEFTANTRECKGNEIPYL